ncbi:GntR family transcriptional regulator [Nocardia sp. NPDC004750]
MLCIVSPSSSSPQSRKARSKVASRQAAKSSGAVSRTDAVYAVIRGDILSGRLTPGQPLRFADLVARYESSIGVIREALNRLVEQGLVDSIAQHGFRVVEISVPALLELTQARCEIESLTLRHAIAEGDVQWEARIVAAHHVLERTPQRDTQDSERTGDDWTEAHRLFHQGLLGGCANRLLLSVASTWRDSSELYRQLSAPLGHDQDRDLVTEHREILEACLGRDADLACERLTRHIRRTTDKLVVALQALS